MSVWGVISYIPGDTSATPSASLTWKVKEFSPSLKTK